ncbi:hypothetical protein JW962_03790 [Candidatus Dojkabacteria bacterium]|nr:hypothetical protein [Candidatus Dojkabacteria bacterium]
MQLFNKLKKTFGLRESSRINRYFNIVSTFFFVIFALFSTFRVSPAYAGSIEQAALVALANVDRISRGLIPLQVNNELVAAAYLKAYDMLDKQYWAHYGPSGESPWMYILSSGYDYTYAGENLAYGFEDSSGVHEAWMNSPTHRDNILNNSFIDVGIAVVKGFFEGSETTLVVQLFGSLGDSSKTVDISSKPLNILYPTEGSVVIDELFGVLGTVSTDVQNPLVQIFMDGESIGGAIISSGTFSKRLNFSKRGGHKLTADLLDSMGNIVYSDMVNYEIANNNWVQLAPTNLSYERLTDDTYNLTGTVTKDVLKANIKTSTDVINCNVINQSLTCVVPKKIFEQKNKQLILLDNSGTAANVGVDNLIVYGVSGAVFMGSNVLGRLLTEGQQMTSKFLNRGTIGLFLSIFVMIEIIRVIILWRNNSYKGHYGYRVLIFMLALFAQLSFTGGGIVI